MPSKALEKYLSNYGGINDPYLRVLKSLKNNYEIKRVMYPGSWIHLTPSLVFPYVVYVDNFAKMESMLSDPELLEYIGKYSEIYGELIIKVHQIDYRAEIPEEKTSFDLLISLSSGFVSQYCGLYLKKNGILFVNNEHHDATKAFEDKDFLPIGAFTSNGKLIHQPKSIQEYFLTKKNEVITSEMVTENSKRSPSKAKYKLKKKAQFYLFSRL
jgi:hypothetical protein